MRFSEKQTFCLFTRKPHRASLSLSSWVHKSSFFFGEHLKAAVTLHSAGDARSRSSLHCAAAAEHNRKQCVGRGQLNLSKQSD